MSSIKLTPGLRSKSLLFFLTARIFITISFQMLAVAVGWQIYSLTHSPFYLGLVGLVQFLPMLMLTLVVGYTADRYDRRLIICISEILGGIGILFLACGSYTGNITKYGILTVIFFIAAAYAFQGPPMQALLPNIVSGEDFPRAAALLASASQLAVILGPALGGIFYSLGADVVYGISGFLSLMAAILIFFISIGKTEAKSETVNIKSIFAGISFIKSKPIILGAISLDLFAVLFGGATALLPVYAGTILKTGPAGLGLLRSAPAAGALLMSAILAKKPLKQKVGRTMFIAVMFFGISTIIFAVSTSFVLSLLILCIMGASDVISVVIRSTLIQMETPDVMRGRVSSVNQLFIGTSNQLGEFESGITAGWFGAVHAVLIGGIGTICVVMLWMKLFPELRHANKFERPAGAQIKQ